MRCARAQRLGVVTATLAEGPIEGFAPRTVLWVDIPAGVVHMTSLDGSDQVIATVDEPVGFVGRIRGGDLIVGTPTGFRIIDAVHGHPHVATLPHVSSDLRMNDGAPDPVGRLLGGTMAVDDADDADGAGTLWSWNGEEVRALRSDVTISNGLAWSGDGATMYYVDTPTGRIDAHAYDNDGLLGPRCTVAEIPAALGRPDGMTIDADGYLWVAVWGGGVVVQIDPDTGCIRPRIEVALATTTSCALLTDGARTVAVVTAAETAEGAGDGGLFAAEVDARPGPTHLVRLP